MFKHKTRSLFFSKHGKLRFQSASSAASMATSMTQPEIPERSVLNSSTRFSEPPNPQFSQFSDLSSGIHFLGSPNPQFSHFSEPKRCLSVLIKCRSLAQIRQVHAQLATTGMILSLFLTNKLLYMYCQYKALGDAWHVFDKMTERESFSWSVMVGGFYKISDYMNCFGIFREAIRLGVCPDNYTLPFVTRACRDTTSLQIGRSIHNVVYKFGMHLDSFVAAALVDMYAKCHVIEDARQLFDTMPIRDLVSWTVMIGGYAECENANESLILFDRMMEEGVIPDKVALVSTVYACAKLGAMHKARIIHDYILEKRFSLDVILGTAMIDMYSKCGSIESAREIFDVIKERNVISWSAMISAHGYHGQGQKALDLFPMMLNRGISPNRITFLSLLYACSHSGLVEEGLYYFSLMWEEYAVKQDVKHYTCMVDLLGRAGRLDEALKMIENMTPEGDEGIWSALLGACRIHKCVELAEKAAKFLLELQSRNPSHYVLLSNIYANAGRWEDVAKIRELMNRRRLKKIPGWTWIEVGNNIHQFSVADTTHPRLKDIHAMLEWLSKKLELAGYIPDTNFVLHDVDEEVKVGILKMHSEKLAIAFGLIATAEGTPIRITKNLRVCGDCHMFSKFVSSIMNRVIIVRDANRFHHFKDGVCSCGDYW